MNLSRRTVMLMVLGVCAGCTSTRWAGQWEELAKAQRSPKSPHVTAPEAAQAFGLRGFRFARAGAVLYEKLDAADVPWSMAVGEVVATEWVADPLQLSGHLIATSIDERLFVGIARRLAVRERSSTPLLMVAVDRDLPPFRLPASALVFDLDIGTYGDVPAGVSTYHCVSSQARKLALSEMERVVADRRHNRLSDAEARDVQDKLARYLAVDPSLCR